MHIPKCGGSTLNFVLDKVYGPEAIYSIDNTTTAQQFRQLPQAEQLQYKLLRGHEKFGMHTCFLDEPHYFTFLRDPAERIISYYYYVQRMPGHRTHQMASSMGLGEFVKSYGGEDFHNSQLKYISGFDGPVERMFEKALENIHQHFSFVGLVEAFDASALMLSKLYGWKLPLYKKNNVGTNRMEVDGRTLAMIQELNHGDYLLYNHVRSTFNEAIKRGGIGFQKDLFIFRQRKNFRAYRRKMRKKYPWLPYV